MYLPYGNTSTVTTYEEGNNQLDPRADFKWKVNDVGFLDFRAGWDLDPIHYWKKEISEKANTRISKEEYESTPWYWRPAHEAIYHWTSSVVACPWTAGQTKNQPAELVDTISTKVVSSENTDILTVYITHNGISQKFQISVITETRNCVYNQ